MRCLFIFTFILIYSVIAIEKSSTITKRKDVTSYNDADLERLYQEWEENEDEKDEDEDVKAKPLDLDSMKAKAKSPEELLKMSKKGQTLMMFVGFVDPSKPGKTDIRHFTEEWAKTFQSALYQNHMDVNIFVVEDNRAIFFFKDGSQAFEAKEYLVKQDQITEILIEGREFPGAGAGYKKKSEL